MMITIKGIQSCRIDPSCKEIENDTELNKNKHEYFQIIAINTFLSILMQFVKKKYFVLDSSLIDILK